jgi:phasin family protein
MNTAIYENLNKFGKGSYENMKGLYVMQTKTAEQLIEQQMALMSLGIEFFTRQMKLASEAKGYKEVLSGQTEITTEVSSKVQGIARNTLDIINESRDELNAWFENCVKETEKGIKEAAKTVPISKAA